MQIKVVNDGDGCTHVSVVNPATEETIGSSQVLGGQQIVVTVPEAHDADDIQVGAVTAAETDEEPTAEAPDDESGSEAEETTTD